MARETWVQSQVESYQRLKKWYLMLPCLAVSIIRFGSRVKWSNPGRGVASFPTPRCPRYWKGNLQVTLNHSHQLYFTYDNNRYTKHSSLWIISILMIIKNTRKIPSLGKVGFYWEGETNRKIWSSRGHLAIRCNQLNKMQVLKLRTHTWNKMK